MSRTHVILVTHTAERLRRTLLGVSCQTVKPDTVVLSCDRDDHSIRETAQAACDEFGLSLTLILRATCGVARVAQVRNNAVRHLLEGDINTEEALIFFDGDCVPEPEAIAKHCRALRRGRLVLGGRYELNPIQTESFDEQALREGRFPAEPTQEQRLELTERRERLLKQARARRLGLGRLGFVKPHKPKMIGANFSTTLGTYLAVNGMDETYEQWAQEDDDLARRIYQLGARPVVEVGTIHSFHQHHPSRAPEDWKQSPNANRLSEPAPTRCLHGLDNPLDQPRPVIETLTPHRSTIAI